MLRVRDAARSGYLGHKRLEERGIENPAPTSVPHPSGSGTGSATLSTADSTGNSLRSFSAVRNSWKMNELILQIRLYEDWDNEVDIHGILGDPISEEIKELGAGSDTFTGSFEKTLKYDGLEMLLFSPKQNGKSFWVLSMQTTSPKYSTTRHVTVGDSLQQLQESYPHIEIAKDGRTDPNNCAYEIADNESFLWFEIEDGIIKEIKIYYEIN